MTDDSDDLEAFFATYRQAYTELDLDAIVEHYDVPLLSVTPEERYWLTSREEIEGIMAAYLDTLRDGNYDHGEIDAIEYHRLTDVDVLVSSAWTRYTTDGDVFERLGTTYLLRDTDEGWKIYALVLHDPETAIV